jgi:hypothetical protein
MHEQGEEVEEQNVLVNQLALADDARMMQVASQRTLSKKRLWSTRVTTQTLYYY